MTSDLGHPRALKLNPSVPALRKAKRKVDGCTREITLMTFVEPLYLLLPDWEVPLQEVTNMFTRLMLNNPLRYAGNSTYSNAFLPLSRKRILDSARISELASDLHPLHYFGCAIGLGESILTSRSDF